MDDATDRHSTVLVVEDNARDVRLIQEVFRDSQIKCDLHVARSGEHALEMLGRQGAFANTPVPDLVLLDLNLPVLSGFDVLAHIKQHPTLRMIPVLILTTSVSESDIRTCYALHANSFLRKPLDLDEFTNLMQSVNDFWLTRAQPPPKLPAQKAALQ